MKDKKPLNFQDHSIPADVAVFRTSRWRNIYKDTMKCPDEQILRAFFIPIQDVIDLYNYYTDHQVDISGVRGYLGHRSIEPISPGVYDCDLILVPVGLDGKDITAAPPSLGLGDGGSTIYDFTSPCPTNCDKSSILYSNPT